VPGRHPFDFSVTDGLSSKAGLSALASSADGYSGGFFPRQTVLVLFRRREDVLRQHALFRLVLLQSFRHQIGYPLRCALARLLCTCSFSVPSLRISFTMRGCHFERHCRVLQTEHRLPPSERGQGFVFPAATGLADGNVIPAIVVVNGARHSSSSLEWWPPKLGVR
jgi:hypothetical protein